MNLKNKSKTLSYLLRHGAMSAGLKMDEAGWASITDVCRLTHLTEAQLNEVIARNNKQRLQREGDRIRCSQGHSTDGMPVTQAALEASWERIEPRGLIYHGTQLKALPEILAKGLLPMGRTHVHLAASPTSRVGKRANVAVLLHIDPARLSGLWRSPNGVVLARAVPPEAIVEVEPVTARAKAALG